MTQKVQTRRHRRQRRPKHRGGADGPCPEGQVMENNQCTVKKPLWKRLFNKIGLFKDAESAAVPAAALPTVPIVMPPPAAAPMPPAMPPAIPPGAMPTTGGRKTRRRRTNASRIK